MINISIFTREKNEKLLNLISDLEKQSFKNFDITIFSDKSFEYKNINIINTNKKNISEKRNLAIQLNQKKYLFLLDDDNRIYDNNFLKNILEKYKKIENNFWEVILSPTIYWRDTKQIQSSWIYFNFFLWKVFANNQKIDWEYKQIKAIWWNSLFWKTKTFKKAKFDENIWFIWEDIDYCYSLWEKWVKFFITNDIINHQERNKTKAEKSFISWNWFYKKIKNRNIFVKKHWKIYEKILYYSFWYWLWIIYWYVLKTFYK